MKRIISLAFALALIAALLCGCAQKAEDGIRDAASKVESGAKELFGTEGTEPYTAVEETVYPTEPDDIISDIATELQDMVDDGTVDDSDGYVGDLENNDGD